MCQPVFQTWKKDGARAAVERYRHLKETREQEYDFHENILLRIGSRLCTRGLYEDASEFLLGCIDLYPGAEYEYYSHYLAAQCFDVLDRREKAIEHCRESLRINPDFEGSSALLGELTGEPEGK